MALRDVTLDDKYTLETGRIFVTGIQALVRLPMLQKLRDQRNGLNTAGYISGYRGSPLGALDQQLVRARQHLEQHDVHFQPGVNEELAATACSGTQQINLDGAGRYDGVFAMWYGKGPGVDRSGDALRHGNNFGTAPHGGVLVLMGDDHACESSTTAHQSEYAMIDAMIPVLHPAGVQDILDYGLYGIALSRYSGCFVGFKCVHDTVEATASIDIDPSRTSIVIPKDHELPQDGLSIRYPDGFLEQEDRLHTHKLEAVKAFVRANNLDKIVIDSHKDSEPAWLGIATTGKSYLDVRQALIELGIDDALASQLGIRLYKLALTWPLEPQGVVQFADGLRSIIVVEEKRGVIEDQLKGLLYGAHNAPDIIGKRDENGDILFHSTARLNAAQIAVQLGQRIVDKTANTMISERLDQLRDRLNTNAARTAPAMARTPYFCAGCPHNTGTKVPEGSHALSGIGCHFMAQWMGRSTARYTQMGGEGASWVGEAPFSQREHMFQNMGDGTYYHSGILALRAAVAAGVNVTFKVLFNDAVAMTGGQPMDGPLTPSRITQQAYAEGAKRIAVVTDEPDKYGDDSEWAPGVTIHHRRDFDVVQRELREVTGTSLIVYDQTCASEKRRRRKRGEFPDPPKRLFINEAVCEGCGDCGVQSNCVAITPVETPVGRKRRIDQSACNKDYSCVNGFCPSFVTVHGGQLSTPSSNSGVDKSTDGPAWQGELTPPVITPLQEAYPLVLTGVGGTGVVTVGAIIGMAAHIADMGCSILDMAGLAQKGGSVTSHIILGPSPQSITTTHVAAGGAKLLLGCDLVTSAAGGTLDKTDRDATRAIVNTHEMMTGDFTLNPNKTFPQATLRDHIIDALSADHVDFVNTTRLSERLLGNTIGANFMALGFAWQKGWLPVPEAAITQAIKLNGQAVAMNLEAFLWGRRAALDLKQVETIAAPKVSVAVPSVERSSGMTKNRKQPVSSDQLGAFIDERVTWLTDYQDAEYADAYHAFVNRIAEIEHDRLPNQSRLAYAVARYLYKLMAYKDEYEVARLYTAPAFQQALDEQFDGDYKLEFHLSPPLLARRDPVTGRPRKMTFGPWMHTGFRWLARFRHLRGSKWDVFGYTEERKTERALIVEYQQTIERAVTHLNAKTHQPICDLAELPESIKGFGPVKADNLQNYRSSLTAAMNSLTATSTASEAA